MAPVGTGMSKEQVLDNDLAHDIVSDLEEEKDAYAHGAHRPLRSYAVLSAGYAAILGGLAYVARRHGTLPPDRVRLDELALLTVATAKVSRIIAKDPITSPLRAPFTRFEGRSGEAELAEEARGDGFRHAVGELLTCPFCVGQWVATGFGAGLVFAPRAARLAAAVGTTVAGADVLQYGFAGLQQAWKRASQ